MGWKVEVTPQAIEDQRRIFRFLFETHIRDFERSTLEARNLAQSRVRTIVLNLKRLAAAPYVGTRHSMFGYDLRHVTIERAIYWFTLLEAEQTVRIEAIFYGTQNHMERMMARMEAPGGAD